MDTSSIPELLAVQVPMVTVIREMNEETRGIFEQMFSNLEKYLSDTRQNCMLRGEILAAAERLQSYLDCVRHILEIPDTEPPAPNEKAETITVGYGQRE